MLRLNLDIPPIPAASQNRYGALAGDLAGFPNGRRVGDDALDIVVQVAMGAVCASEIPGVKGVYCNASDAVVGAVLFRDGVGVDATLFPSTFPFLNTPNSAGVQTLTHPSKCLTDLPCNGCTPCNSAASLSPFFALVVLAAMFLFHF